MNEQLHQAETFQQESGRKRRHFTIDNANDFFADDVPDDECEEFSATLSEKWRSFFLPLSPDEKSNVILLDRLSDEERAELLAVAKEGERKKPGLHNIPGRFTIWAAVTGRPLPRLAKPGHEFLH